MAEGKKEEYTARIGPKLRAILDKQKDKIRDVTYNCMEVSDYEAGEIIAMKVEL